MSLTLLAYALMALRSARANLSCPISGTPSAIPENILPNKGDVLRYWRLLANTEVEPGLIPTRHEMAAKIASNVFDIWEMASIPTIIPTKGSII